MPGGTRRVGVGFVVGAATSVALVAALGAAHAAAGLPFLPFDLFEWVTRALPGAVVTAGVETVVSIVTALDLPTAAAAKVAEEAIAIAIFVAASSVLGAGVGATGPRVAARLAGPAAGAIWLVAAIALERSAGAVGVLWSVVAFAAWGAALGWAVTRAAAGEATRRDATARRRFLASVVAASAGASAVLVALTSLARRARGASASRAAPPVGSGELTSARAPAVDAGRPRPPPVAGTRAEITPNDRFYRIDIDLEPPRVDASSWRLRVDGLVDAPRELTIEQLRAMPSVSQIVTLECISNRVGGDLVSTSLWTGVRLRDLLRAVGASDRARAVHMTSADGFYESVAIEDANDERTLLVYAMNGVPLPVPHGFPLRVYIPNRYGMKQPKWLTRLHVSDRPGRGYWVDRGWTEQAIVKTTSVIDAVGAPQASPSGEVVPVGGIAYAGARGVSRVEVQVDDGPWREATLIAPPPSPLTWVLWRYDWPYAPGRHTFRVRAYDGTGALQPTRARPPHPDGASGIDARSVDV